MPIPLWHQFCGPFLDDFSPFNVLPPSMHCHLGIITCHNINKTFGAPFWFLCPTKTNENTNNRKAGHLQIEAGRRIIMILKWKSCFAPKHWHSHWLCCHVLFIFRPLSAALGFMAFHKHVHSNVLGNLTWNETNSPWPNVSRNSKWCSS